MTTPNHRTTSDVCGLNAFLGLGSVLALVAITATEGLPKGADSLLSIAGAYIALQVLANGLGAVYFALLDRNLPDEPDHEFVPCDNANVCLHGYIDDTELGCGLPKEAHRA